MYMDDIKVFAKNEKEFETLIHTVRIYSQDIRVEFGNEKCSLLIMRRGKQHTTNKMELPNQEKESYKYIRILESNTIKKEMMKEKKLKNISEEQ